MPGTCCVPGCTNRGGFNFPKDEKKCKVWVARICRQNEDKSDWCPTQNSRVCHVHFDEDDIIIRKAKNSDKMWRFLRPDALPLRTTGRPPSVSSVERRARAKKRRIDSAIQSSEQDEKSSNWSRNVTEEDEDITETDGEDITETGGEDDENKDKDEDGPPDVVVEVEVTTDQNDNVCAEEEEDQKNKETRRYDSNFCDKEDTCANEENEESENEDSLQGPGLGHFSLSAIAKVKGAIHYYTGLSDKHHFDYVFSCLGPAAYELKYKCKKLLPEDEFLLLLMKLRLNKDDKELSMFFGISLFTVARIFKTWLSFAYFQLKELDIWSSRELVNAYMPTDFKRKFPKTRVIIDGTEIPIDKPKDPKDQSATWSNYKNKNTLKVLVGISPKGDITHISDVYGGSASDRQIVEKGTLLEEGMFEKDDSIMADRGFIVHDLFCLRHVSVNVPTVMRGMTQLPAQNVISDRRIASKRVHVERMIGLAKHFRILKEDLNHFYIPLGGRILFVCLALTNFKPAIVNNDA